MSPIDSRTPFKPSSSSQIKSDGLNMNETDGGTGGRGARRSGRGSKLLSKLRVQSSWLKSSTQKNIHYPRQIANEIRHLRGHVETTISGRHKDYEAIRIKSTLSPCRNYEKLFSHCMNLITIASRASNSEEKTAKEQFLKLSVEDPYIYFIFQECRRDIQSKTPPPQISRLEKLDAEDVQIIHLTWSKLIANHSFRSDGDEPISETRSLCEALKDTFSVDNHPYIAGEYLPHAMALEYQNEDLELLRQLWDHFLDCVTARSDLPLWIDNMDLCFKNIISSNKPLAYFASPSQLERIANYLVEHSSKIPFVLSTFFSAPNFEYHDTANAPYGAKLVYSSPIDNWNIITASIYARSFFLGSERTHQMYTGDNIPGFIKKIGTGTPLKRTVFSQGNTFDGLYKIANNAVSSYRRGVGVHCSGKLRASVRHALVGQLESSLQSIAIASFSNRDMKDKDVPENNFYIAQTVDIDRYHKHAMLEHFDEIDAYINVLNDRLRFQTYLRLPDGICKITYTPQFQNVSYLRRFRIGSNYLITANLGTAYQKLTITS
ncbi:hypothetical protein SCHPADRAFT_145337 [Schizopora paradoxa]|uniref:Uncharacterized protein n=1 Tax=Schizopora paradoxa TaxID=27342 RepID=A0A0H2S870_9AGAM|nr:hypothetical protein SCHPADRAFT_145337 [Schizopora paradoxa]